MPGTSDHGKRIYVPFSGNRSSVITPAPPPAAATTRPAASCVRVILTMLAVWTLASFGAVCRADHPLQALFPFRRVEADPNQDYQLREEHGPWLVLAATFLGEEGERQARALVLELRSRYRLRAYMYKRKFDYGDTVIGLGVDKYGNPKRMRYVHSSKFEEIAVLVGDFHSVDDPQAQKVREQLKYLHPEALRIDSPGGTRQRMAVWRMIQQHISPNTKIKKMGPMRAAFVTRNPLLPDELFAPKGPDKVIMELNRGLEYSLLDCPGNYTVRVATFRGKSTWDLREIEHAQRQKPFALGEGESQLAQAAENAARLTFALRKRGIEAYQFHDRHESIVTVGSFDSVGTPRKDGKTEINPAVHKIMQQFGATVQDLPGLPGAMTPRTLEGIPFDAQPLPVKVPRPSLP